MNWKQKIRRYALCFIVFFVCFHTSTRLLCESVENEREATLRMLVGNARSNFENESVGAFLEEDDLSDISSLSIIQSGTPSCNDRVELLVAVFSKASDFEVRKEIRRTWASSANYNATFTRVLFVTARDEVGVASPPLGFDYQNATKGNIESDVLEINYGEGYRKLSMKTYGLLTFVRDGCPKAQCILKIDSDVVANLQGIEDLCKLQDDEPTISGFSYSERVPVNRDASSKFYVPFFVYKHDFYPPYTEGPAYLLSGHHVAALLIDALKKTSFMRSENFRRLPEDVLFTGIARALAGMSNKFVSGFSMRKDDIFLYWCIAKKSPTPLIYHGASPISQYWRTLKEKRENAQTFGWLRRLIACQLNNALSIS